MPLHSASPVCATKWGDRPESNRNREVHRLALYRDHVWLAQRPIETAGIIARRPAHHRAKAPHTVGCLVAYGDEYAVDLQAGCRLRQHSRQLATPQYG